MTYTDRHIVETYAGLLTQLSAESKTALIENLSKSLKSEQEHQEDKFYKSFGAFVSDKSAEDIINDIRSARKFRNRETKI